MTTFNDIFKSSFLNNVAAVSIPDMALTLFLCLALGMFIFLIYKRTYAGVMYSSSFGVTLVALTMITGMTILAVTSNVVLSLGMVGALSIVRFRTAVKEPMDLVFLFWAISGGIVLAAGMLPLAIAGSLVIGLVLLALANQKTTVQPYILVLSCSDEASEQQSLQILAAGTQKHQLKCKTVRSGRIELNLEVRLKGGETDFVNRLQAIGGVDSVSLVSYNGEYMG